MKESTMSNTPNLEKLDALAAKLGEAALTIVVRACRHEVAAATNGDLDAVCAAMRAQAPVVLDRLLDDVATAPWMADFAFNAAALELAHAGISVLRERHAAAAS